MVVIKTSDKSDRQITEGNLLLDTNPLIKKAQETK
jgi:hypothetical protein